MTSDLRDEVRRYAEHVDGMVPTLTVGEIVSMAAKQEAGPRLATRWKPAWVAAAAFLLVLLAIGVVGLLPSSDRPDVADQTSSMPSTVAPSTVAATVAPENAPSAPGEPEMPSSTVVTPPRGYVWSEIPLSPEQFTAHSEIRGVTNTGSHFAAVGRVDSDCTQVWVSRNGTVWGGAHAQGGGLEIPCRATLYDIATDERLSVAVGQKDDLPAMWVSEDGYDWDLVGRVEPPFSAGDEIQSVAGSDLGFVAAGTSVWFSPAGQTWHEAVAPPLEWITDVTAGPEGFVAVGSLPDPVTVADGQWSSANAVLHSADGQTWTVVAELEGILQAGDDCWVAANAVTHGPHGYVVAGDCTSISTDVEVELAHGSMWTSHDAITWTQVPYDRAAFDAPASIATITADELGYVAAGWSLSAAEHSGTVSSVTIWFSEDGESWIRTAVPGEGAHLVYDIAVHEGTAVAVGQGDSGPAIWRGFWR